MKRHLFSTSLLALATSLSLLPSCTPYQQQGAAVGALGGAALGAIAGKEGKDIARGAAIGAAAGTGVAAYREEQARRNNYNNTQSSQPAPNYTPPTPAPVQTQPSVQSYPKATSGLKPNTVISPYAPYNILDVSGYPKGSKVCDPSTIPVDPLTGKQYINPATGNLDTKRGKYFIVP